MEAFIVVQSVVEGLAYEYETADDLYQWHID